MASVKTQALCSIEKYPLSVLCCAQETRSKGADAKLTDFDKTNNLSYNAELVRFACSLVDMMTDEQAAEILNRLETRAF